MLRHAGYGLLLVLGLAACTTPTSTRIVDLADGDIQAVSPDGYCIDSVASQPRRDFAMLTPCAALGEGARAPDIVGVATIKVGPPDSGTIAAEELALRDFILTDAGTALLSQSGDASNVTVLSTQAFDDQVMVHFTDTSAPPVAGLQNEEWRAFCNINGRLVTVAVRGLAGAPLQDGPGATLLKQVVAGIQGMGVDNPVDVSDS